MLACSQVDGPLVVGIMTEFAAAGSLAAYLRSGVGFVPLRRRACLALHAVNGMAYLHAQHVSAHAARLPQQPAMLDT